MTYRTDLAYFTADDLIYDEHQATLDETATAVFSPDRRYRYALTRIWDPDWPLAAFVMLNPSTADAFQADPTIRRCIGFARTWHAGGIVVLNLFALRSPDPTVLRADPDPVGPDNDAVIAHTFSTAGPLVGPVVAAWGSHGGLLGRGEAVRRMLTARCSRVLCLGITRDRHPRHPLYLRADTPTIVYKGESDD